MVTKLRHVIVNVRVTGCRESTEIVNSNHSRGSSGKKPRSEKSQDTVPLREMLL
jgi:hypothetical protein